MKRGWPVYLSALAAVLMLAAGCGVSQEQHDTLLQDYSTLRQQHLDLEQDHTAAQQRYGDLDREYAALREQHRVLEQENAALRESLSAATEQVERLTQQNTALAEEVESLRREAEALAQVNGDLESANAELSSALAGLEGRLGEVERVVGALRDENGALKARVAELEKQLDAHFVVGFTCTRSMVPAMDCGDEGVFTRAFEPADITVGTVISFVPPASCGTPAGRRIAHRVVEIQLVDGTPQYRTRGDNAPRPDRCWIPYGNVDGVLVKVNKGARPQDVLRVDEHDAALERAHQLEEAYDVARASHQEARDTLGERLAEHRAAQAEYVEAYSRHCGFPPDDERACSLQEPDYSEVMGLFNRAVQMGEQAESARQQVSEWISRLERLEQQLVEAWQEVYRLRCEQMNICQ